MSDLAIFIVGVVIFAITVAGSVYAGGLSMQVVHRRQNPALYDETPSRLATDELDES